jgi:hypothetical protein
MNFENALKMMRHGVPMTRNTWEDQNRSVVKEKNSLVMQSRFHEDKGDYIELPYAAGHADLLATDWEVARPPPDR